MLKDELMEGKGLGEAELRARLIENAPDTKSIKKHVASLLADNAMSENSWAYLASIYGDSTPGTLKDRMLAAIS